MEVKQERVTKAYLGFEPYIFVSYARQDADSVVRIIDWLKCGGYRVWYDEGIRIGEDFTDEIALRLEDCACFLVFISNFSISRKFVQKEIKYAEKKEKLIIPVYLEKNVPIPAGIGMIISSLQGVEYFRMGWGVFTDYLKQTLPPELIGHEPVDPPPEPRSFRRAKLIKKLKEGAREAGGFLLHYGIQILLILAASAALWILQNKFDLIGRLFALLG